MRIGMLMATGCVFAALAVACGSSDSGGGGGGSGGAAGSAGAGGSSGAGGSAGSGGSTTGDPCTVPQCFMDVMAACMPTGTCTTETSGDMTSGMVSNACYENGVKWSTSMTTGTGGITSQMKGYKTDGSVCFTADATTDAGGNNTTVYKDPGGTTLVTVTVAGGKMTYACGGQTITIDPSACPKGDGGTTSPCTPGTCTVP